MLSLYYKPSCPYSLRVRLVLAEKHIPFSRRVDPNDLPPEVLELSEGKVPVLVDGSLALTDSTVIAEYLEDAFPNQRCAHSTLAVGRWSEQRCEGSTRR